jgi:hypothetical protein
MNSLSIGFEAEECCADSRKAPANGRASQERWLNKQREIISRSSNSGWQRTYDMIRKGAANSLILAVRVLGP